MVVLLSPKQKAFQHKVVRGKHRKWLIRYRKQCVQMTYMQNLIILLLFRVNINISVWLTLKTVTSLTICPCYLSLQKRQILHSKMRSLKFHLLRNLITWQFLLEMQFHLRCFRRKVNHFVFKSEKKPACFCCNTLASRRKPAAFPSSPTAFLVLCITNFFISDDSCVLKCTIQYAQLCLITCGS